MRMPPGTEPRAWHTQLGTAQCSGAGGGGAAGGSKQVTELPEGLTVQHTNNSAKRGHGCEKRHKQRTWQECLPIDRRRKTQGHGVTLAGNLEEG